MFAVRTVAVRAVRAPVAVRTPVVALSVRFMSGVEDAGNSWKKREKAAEENYFKKLEADKRKAFGEKLHSKELQSLLKILGDKHGLTEAQIHDLLEWKHAA